MTIQQAIEKAIAGGYSPYSFVSIEKIHNESGFAWMKYTSKDGIGYCIDLEHMVLDPAFWRALGKTEGWGDSHESWCDSLKDYCTHPGAKCECEQCDCSAQIAWKQPMIDLTAYLADGGTIESYFAAL